MFLLWKTCVIYWARVIKFNLGGQLPKCLRTKLTNVGLVLPCWEALRTNLPIDFSISTAFKYYEGRSLFLFFSVCRGCYVAQYIPAGSPHAPHKRNSPRQSVPARFSYISLIFIITHCLLLVIVCMFCLRTSIFPVIWPTYIDYLDGCPDALMHHINDKCSSCHSVLARLSRISNTYSLLFITNWSSVSPIRWKTA